MISKEQVEHIAKLARLKLTPEEVLMYQKDLSQVLDYFSLLQKADTENTHPMTHAVVQENITREDAPQKELPGIVSALMKLAPALRDGFLKVKTILSFK